MVALLENGIRQEIKPVYERTGFELKPYNGIFYGSDVAMPTIGVIQNIYDAARHSSAPIYKRTRNEGVSEYDPSGNYRYNTGYPAFIRYFGEMVGDPNLAEAMLDDICLWAPFSMQSITIGGDVFTGLLEGGSIYPSNQLVIAARRIDPLLQGIMTETSGDIKPFLAELAKAYEAPHKDHRV